MSEAWKAEWGAVDMEPTAGADRTKTIKVVARMAAYLLAVTLVFSAISVLCATDTVVFRTTEPGVTDLTDFDFDNAVAQVATGSTNSIFMYPGAFYSSQDFADGSVSVEGILYGNEGTYNQGEYGTLRMVLMLPPGEVYAIAGKNVSYAQRLFIDGKEYPSIGVSGDNARAVTPKTMRYMEGFRPAGDTTEIIIHYSAFVYADGGGLYPLDIGLVRNVARNEQLRGFYIAAVTAVLVTAALFFFGLFLFFPKGRYLLWFALVCVCVALRGLLTSDKFIMLLLPNLDWYLAIRLECILTGGMALFSALYLNGLFPHAVNRWAIRGFAGFCVLSMAFLCLTPTVVFSRFTDSFAWVYAVFVSCLLLAVLIAALRAKLTSPLSGAEQILLLFGLVIYVALSVRGIYAHQNSLSLWGLDYPQVGVMIFLFLNMLALVLGFARTERAMAEFRRKEQEYAEENALLDRLNKLKTEFLGNISHELKTPLAVMSSHAQLTRQHEEKSGSKDDYVVNRMLLVSSEAERMSVMVSQLLDIGRIEENRMEWNFGTVNLAALINGMADTFYPVLNKNHNKLVINLPPDSGNVWCDTVRIRQVLLNLISNAIRFTRHGIVTVSANTEGAFTAISITDTGEGIAPELLPNIFDRYYSREPATGGSYTGTGLGLYISKRIIEAHGGMIDIKSELGSGTTATFTLPSAKPETGGKHDGE